MHFPVKIRKISFMLMWMALPLGVAGQIYQAGQSASAAPSSARWEISAGWTRGYMGITDHTADTLFSNQTGLSARGLYYFTPWLAVGPEGVWFEEEKFAANNRFKNTRYGAVAKWTLTPDTLPAAYFLTGVGSSARKLSYMGIQTRSSHSAYALVGTGVEVPISHGIFLAAEVQAIYHAKKELDGLTLLKRRWEADLSLRGGIRF